MNKFLRFTLTSLGIVAARAYDAYCTMQYTPDLSHEANPLVSVLGFGWTPLLTVVGLLTLYSVYAYYVRTFSPSSLFPESGEFTLMGFSAFLYFGKREHWTAAFYKLPKSLKRFNQYWGAIMTPCIVFLSVVSTIMWLLIKYTDNYMRDYHSAPLIYGILLTGFVVISLLKSNAYFTLYKSGAHNAYT